MLEPGAVVRQFYERMQARDWTEAAELLSPTVEIRFTSTGERFVGPSFLAMNRAFPEGWTINVHEVLCVGQRVATQVQVDQDGATYWCAGFYTVSEGRIVDGVEHWVTEHGELPPPWRQPFTTSTDLR